MPKEIGEELYYTLEEIEDTFGITPATLIDLIKQDKLTAKKMNDEWLISEAALKEYRDTIEKENE
jgi:hypothetical protein